jgi:hypothetical protein
MQAPVLQIFKECPARDRIFFGARGDMKKRLLTVDRKAPGHQNCLAGLTQMQSLGQAVNEQISDFEFR